MAIPFILLGAVTVALAVISVAEHYGSSPGLYTSWWMIALWALTVVASAAVIWRRHLLRRPVMALMHAALLMILAGALTTHVTGVSGALHLRSGEAPERTFLTDEGVESQLPVALSLVSFDIETYPGTGTPRDFVSTLNGADGTAYTVSMNRPATVAGYKLLQGTYDSDCGGVTLSVSHDPWGTGLTYLGYMLLGISFIAYFFVRGSAWRRSLRALRGVAAMLLVATGASTALAGNAALDGDALDRLGVVAVNHSDRIAPLSTLARDFTVNICGSTSYEDYSADEVLAGFLFEFGTWKDEPVLRIKDRELAALLGVSDTRRISYADFYAATADGRLDIDDPQVVQRYNSDIQRFEAVNMLVGGSLLRVFPVADGDRVVWYAPTDRLPRDMDEGQWLFIRKFWGLYNEQVIRGDVQAQAELLEALDRYQRSQLGDAMPEGSQLRLERAYNSVSSPLPLAIISLVVGLILFVAAAVRPVISRRRRILGVTVGLLLAVALTVLLAMRWMVCGHVPVSNGYETMMFMAWCIMLISLIWGRGGVLMPLSLIAAGLALSVAAMSGDAGSVTGLMPVLHSPLLSIHVACVMASYALFLLMALTGVLAFCGGGSRAGRLADLSRVMLYPALMLLASGIFIGAIWADVSWGRYWGWDPKEVWALITMLVYTPVAHRSLLPAIAKPRIYHYYCMIAFVSVLITYFGVNFLLGGLHSYA